MPGKQIPSFVRISRMGVNALALLLAFAYLPNAAAQTQNKGDLTVTDIVVSPLQPAVNQPVTITVSGLYTGPDLLTDTTGIGSYLRDFPNFLEDSSRKPVLSPLPSLTAPLKHGDVFTHTFYGSFRFAGENRLAFTIDHDQQLAEWDEGNNKLTRFVNVLNTFDLPDIRAVGMTMVPSVPRANEEVSVTVEARYTGNTNLISLQGIGSVKHEFQDFTASASAIQPSVSPTKDNPLLPGTSFTYTFTGSFGSPGVKQISFTIDSANELYESDETNNAITVAANIQEALPVSPGSGSAPATSSPPSTPPATPTPPVPVPAAPTVSPRPGGFARTLQLGNRGADIIALQKILVSKKYLKTSVFGYFGPLTRNALKKLQIANRLKATGILDQTTRKLLNSGKF